MNRHIDIDTLSRYLLNRLTQDGGDSRSGASAALSRMRRQA